MKPDKSNWDMELLKQVFDDNFVKAIVNIPKWSCEDEDKWIWLKSSNGSLSVKSAYKELSTGSNMDHHNPLLGKIWKTHLHACHKMFLWKRLRGYYLPKISSGLPLLWTQFALCAMVMLSLLCIFFGSAPWLELSGLDVSGGFEQIRSQLPLPLFL